MTDSVKTFVKYGDEFAIKHADELGETAATWGGMVLGLMRAILECDKCPGTFRIPQDEDWNVLYCPNCRQVWHKREK